MNRPLVGALSLEARRELEQGKINATLDLVQCIDDSRTVIERYEQGDFELHLHIVATRQDDRETVVASLDVCLILSRLLRREGDSALTLGDGEMPVFIGVGDRSKEFRPVRSEVRLIPLDDCRMFAFQAAQEGSRVAALGFLQPSPEAQIAIFKRELCSVLLAAGVEPGKLVDEVVEGSPKRLHSLAEQDAHAVWDRDARLGEVERSQYRRIGIRVAQSGDHGIAFSLEQGEDDRFEVVQVFICAKKPRLGTVKRWGGSRIHEVESHHDGQDAEDPEGRGNTDPQAQGLSEEPEEGRRAQRISSELAHWTGIGIEV